MNEKERLEEKAKELRDELKQLNMDLAWGKLEYDSLIREKKRELTKVLMDLELCKMNGLENNVRRK